MNKLMHRQHGWLRFSEGYSMPDPTDERFRDAAHTARYSLSRLTQTQAYHLCEVFEAYHHLMTHPCGTESVIKQLRAVRRALREDKS